MKALTILVILAFASLMGAYAGYAVAGKIRQLNQELAAVVQGL